MQKQIQKVNGGFRINKLLVSDNEMLEVIKETKELIGNFNLNMLINWKA